MADPIEFDEANLKLTAPKGDEDTVREMPAYTDGEFCVSCWQLSPEEMKELAANDGKLWLWVWSGKTQPPVCIDVDNPFEQRTPVDDLVQADTNGVIIGVDEGGKDQTVETKIEIRGTTHIAGAVSDCVQQCTRCLEILGDYRNMMIPEGQKPPHAWAEGAFLTVYPGMPIEYVVGEREDAAHCEPLAVDVYVPCEKCSGKGTLTTKGGCVYYSVRCDKCKGSGKQ